MIYLDNNATAPIDPEVLALVHALQQRVGNPSSIHQFGQFAKGVLADSVRRCAQFFNVHSDEIIFTSGATETLNFLLRGLSKNCHVITSSLEHAAVLEPLKASGAIVTYLDPQPGKGSISPDQVRETLQDNTQMIVLSAANSETGIKTDIETIASIARTKGVFFVVDGVALLGKESFNLPEGVSAACFSGHKIHGPLGIGLAVVRKSFKAPPFIVGGPQQRGLRAGTENFPAIAGFAKALELLKANEEIWIEQIKSLRNHFEQSLVAALPEIIIHGTNEPRVCNTSNISFLGVDGETLLMMLDMAGLAASHGSACTSGAMSPSRVLLSMGIPSQVVRSSLRFSLSRFTTQEEIDASIDIIIKTVSHLRTAYS